MFASEIKVSAYIIYCVIESASNFRKYRRAVLITKSQAKAEIYLNKLRNNYPWKVLELIMTGKEFTLADYLEVLSDIQVSNNPLLKDEVLENGLQP